MKRGWKRRREEGGSEEAWEEAGERLKEEGGSKRRAGRQTCLGMWRKMQEAIVRHCINNELL